MSGIWTRNYTNALCAAFGRRWNGSQTITPEYTDGILATRTTASSTLQITSVEGGIPNIMLKGVGEFLTSNTKQGEPNSLYISVGSGNAIPTYEDYKLETLIGKGIILTTGSPTVINAYNRVNHSYSFKRTFSLQNTSLLNITINEIGLLVNVSSTNWEVTSLMYREVVDTITLEPNDLILITIEQEMPLYNYQPYPV